MVYMAALKRLCFDTDVLIDYFRGPSDTTKQLMKKVHERKFLACTTTINSFEVWLGVYLAPKPEVLIGKTEEIMDQLEIINFNYDASVEAGRILATLRKKGQVIEIRDLFVGSIAKVSEIPLVTRNVKHYERILELTTVTPEDFIEN